MAKLVVISGSDIGKEYQIKDEATIGRDSSNIIRLQDSKVSAKHSKIFNSEGVFIIRDLNSTNGTYINDTRVEQAVLRDNDKIRIGSISFVFKLDDDEAKHSANSVVVVAPESKIEGVEFEIASDTTMKTISLMKSGKSAKLTGEIKDIENSWRNLSILYKIASAIQSCMELPSLLEQIMTNIFELFPVDRGFILLSNKGDSSGETEVSLIPAIIKKRQGIDDNAELSISKTILNKVIKEKKSILTSDAGKDERFQGGQSIVIHSIKSAMCVPMFYKDGNVLGVIYVDNKRQANIFKQDDLNLLSIIGVQAGISLENLYLLEEMTKRKIFDAELEMANEIQMGLLPKKMPLCKNAEFFAMMNPARRVGGDYYDFIPYNNGVNFCIGDVSGKGVPASLIMVMVRTILHSLLVDFVPSNDSPKDIVVKLNKLLFENLSEQFKFVTFILLNWDDDKNKLIYAGAGHEQVMIYRAKEKKCEVRKTGGMALGILPDVNDIVSNEELQLSSGDLILLYTDGVTEAKNKNGDMFEFAQLKDIVEKNGFLSAKELTETVFKSVKEHIGDADQYDDITLLAIKCK